MAAARVVLAAVLAEAHIQVRKGRKEEQELLMQWCKSTFLCIRVRPETQQPGFLASTDPNASAKNSYTGRTNAATQTWKYGGSMAGPWRHRESKNRNQIMCFTGS